MDERTERLLNKAEQAIDGDNIDQGEAYRILASQAFFLRKQDAKQMNRQHGYEDAR